MKLLKPPQSGFPVIELASVLLGGCVRFLAIYVHQALRPAQLSSVIIYFKANSIHIRFRVFKM